MNTPPALHPTDRALHAYGLGQLDDASAGSVDGHLEGCADCRRRVAEITSDSFLGRLRDAKARPASTGPAVSSTDGLSMLDGGGAAIAPPPADTLPPGLADHPDYKIVRELGRGGMGVVYLARNTLMGRREVLKVVGGHLLSRPAILERFQREIRSAARLQHPNIVSAYSDLRLGESLALTMEYVEGIDLSRVVKAKGPLPVANACNYVHQSALGLQHAHEHGMVHRDIKPANLILARASGREGKAVVKVLDFGLAKVIVEGQRESGLTREGQMLGTPDYIAPEQIRDAQSADIRADIYSLGCTLYYLLSGRPPFLGANLWDVYSGAFLDGRRAACPIHRPRDGRYELEFSDKDHRLAGRRREQETPVFARRYAMRAGIELTNSGLKNRLGMKRLRVRGRGSVSRVILHKVAGWNVLRAAASTKLRVDQDSGGGDAHRGRSWGEWVGLRPPHAAMGRFLKWVGGPQGRSHRFAPSCAA